jgi:hypothetical protein
MVPTHCFMELIFCFLNPMFRAVYYIVYVAFQTTLTTGFFGSDLQNIVHSIFLI